MAFSFSSKQFGPGPGNCVGIAFLASLACTTALAQTPTLTNLGAPEGSISVYARDANPAGTHVVTLVSFRGRVNAFRSTAPDTFTPIEPLVGDTQNDPTCVSDSGDIVAGYSRNSALDRNRAFVWSDAVGSRLLRGPSGEERGVAYAMSASGDFIAGAYQVGDREHAVRWTRSGTPTPLGLLPGGDASRVRALSGDGAIAVGSGDSAGVLRGFRWTLDGRLEGLQATAAHEDCEPLAVSSDGSVIVGWAGPSPDDARVIRWRPDGSVDDLGRPAGDWTSAVASTINGDGSIIGLAAYGPSGTRAYIWTQDLGFVDLERALIDLRVPTGGWELRSVSSISENGSTIVGSGVYLGERRAFVIHGLHTFACPADLDGDGSFTIFDFLAFQNAFDAGCV